jgi:biotin carboxyl carrier protein
MSKRKEKKPAYDELLIDGMVYQTTHNKMHRQRKPYQVADPNKITSFMPGNIQEVFVSPGDIVEEGTRLCILEAMKMKNIIVAPHTGTVKSVNVTVGERVPKACVLVELETGSPV